MFSEEETNRILKLIEDKSVKENQESIREEAWDKHSVGDSNAIDLFSQLSIWAFSIAFGVISGRVLLAFNLKKLNKPKVSPIVFSFGILYTVFQFFAVNYLEEINFVIKRQTFLFSGIGALILHYLFWKNYIRTGIKTVVGSFASEVGIARLLTLKTLTKRNRNKKIFLTIKY